MENLLWRSSHSRGGSRKKNVITKEIKPDIKQRSSTKTEGLALLGRSEGSREASQREDTPKVKIYLLQHLHNWSPKMLVEWMNDTNMSFSHSLNILDQGDIFKLSVPFSCPSHKHQLGTPQIYAGMWHFSCQWRVSAMWLWSSLRFINYSRMFSALLSGSWK